MGLRAEQVRGLDRLTGHRRVTAPATLSPSARGVVVPAGSNRPRVGLVASSRPARRIWLHDPFPRGLRKLGSTRASGSASARPLGSQDMKMDAAERWRQ
jgi:hypothetical protein